MTRARTALLCLSWIVACSDTSPPPQPPSFERPSYVAFLCLHETDGALPLSRCAGQDDDDIDEDRVIAMHALVTQSSRGEVAAVDIEEAEVVGPERTLGCVIEISSMMFDPGVVLRHSPPPRSWFAVGSIDPATRGREDEVAALLRCSGTVEIVDDIQATIDAHRWKPEYLPMRPA